MAQSASLAHRRKLWLLLPLAITLHAEGPHKVIYALTGSELLGHPKGTISSQAEMSDGSTTNVVMLKGLFLVQFKQKATRLCHVWLIVG